jgi:outer membrane protein
MRYLTVIAIAALVTAGTGATAADLKFGVVDMSKAFQEFYKTKDATSVMKGNRDKVAQDMNERYTAYKSKMADVQKLQKEVSDPILTQEGRAKAGASLQNLAKEVRSMEQEIQDFQQRSAMKLRQEENDLQRNLYLEIADVVKRKAEADNFDFVFDRSGMSITSSPVLLYSKGATDFTDQVIVELNKNAGTEAKAGEATQSTEAKGEAKKE